MTFTLTNPNNLIPLTGRAFNDTLPVGLVVASPTAILGTCDSGTITANAGGSAISLTGATLAPGGNCAFTVFVSSNGAAGGLLIDTTSTVASKEAPPGAPASASIFIGDPLQITYAANLSAGDSVIDLTNAGRWVRHCNPAPPPTSPARFARMLCLHAR